MQLLRYVLIENPDDARAACNQGLPELVADLANTADNDVRLVALLLASQLILDAGAAQKFEKVSCPGPMATSMRLVCPNKRKQTYGWKFPCSRTSAPRCWVSMVYAAGWPVSIACFHVTVAFALWSLLRPSAHGLADGSAGVASKVSIVLVKTWRAL